MRYISQMRKHRCESSGQSRFIFRAAGTLFNAQTESETRILWCEKTRKPNRAPHRLANSQITLPRVPVRRSKNSVPRSFFKTRIGASRLERRRIARELHDSLGQKVSGLKMNLDRVKKSPNLNSEEAALLGESATLIDGILKEVRTICYLLHPPLLDELGLVSALRSLLGGLSRRSGIKTSFEIDENFGRLPSEMEISIYRIIQECLTNIYHHSGSKSAAVRIQRDLRTIKVEVQDRGKGMSENQTDGGVGLDAMRERAAQLGGTLSIRSSGRGTTIIAHLPVRT